MSAPYPNLEIAKVVYIIGCLEFHVSYASTRSQFGIANSHAVAITILSLDCGWRYVPVEAEILTADT